jgi:amidophosphoribosyltransferase
MGIDMATYDELVAHGRTVKEIQEQIGADSLAYLSHEGMLRAVRAGLAADRGHCSACFTGRYPIRLDEWWRVKSQEKASFEQMWGS